MLAVNDPSSSAGYYRDCLGFDIKGIWQDRYAIVERDGIQIHLIHGGPKNVNPEEFRGGAYVTVNDVDALHRELEERGARPLGKPRDTDYGMREFSIRDLNGWILSFGAPVEKR
jgi:uncharacterized glyoxalase superfamily protein PhnB